MGFSLSAEARHLHYVHCTKAQELILIADTQDSVGYWTTEVKSNSDDDDDDYDDDDDDDDENTAL